MLEQEQPSFACDSLRIGVLGCPEIVVSVTARYLVKICLMLSCCCLLMTDDFLMLRLFDYQLSNSCLDDSRATRSRCKATDNSYRALYPEFEGPVRPLLYRPVSEITKYTSNHIHYKQQKCCLPSKTLHLVNQTPQGQHITCPWSLAMLAAAQQSVLCWRPAAAAGLKETSRCVSNCLEGPTRQP
jgi:hypothetical protein